MSLTVTTSAFSPGGDIPKKHTCDGKDISPALSWSGAPADMKELAILCDDPDAPGGTFTHWVAWGVPGSKTGLAEGARDPEIKLGSNDFGTHGYRGPCPPRGKPHRYFFKVFALDASPRVSPGASATELEAAMASHILAKGELIGKYGR